MLQVVTDEELDALLSRLETAVEEIAAIEDPRRRAIASNDLAEAVHEVNVSIGVVRQDAVWEIKAQVEGSGGKWRHRDTAKLLGIDTVKAGRIANAKLRRDGAADAGDGA
jgi:hypothetical protein